MTVDESALRRGLSAAEVAERTADGRVNEVDNRSSRTIGEIIRANVFTRFNLIIIVLAATMVALGEPKDALFGMVMVANILIGVVQEWRAKVTLDQLSLVSAPTVTVWRDGRPMEVASNAVVLDDVFELRPGDQVVVDGVMIDSDGLTADESLLTGESDAMEKVAGDTVMSGSFIVAGGGLARATAVGADSYAQRLTAEAKKFQAQKSELARGIDRILTVVSWAIPPSAVLLYFGQRADDNTVKEALVGSVAGMVALVPQGLVLLLSMAQAVAVIRLGRKKVLVQQLQAVETLARVTVLATDKTGTLTDGAVSLSRLDVLAVIPEPELVLALAAVAAADEFPNATMSAIKVSYPTPPEWVALGRIPFDSAHKYSAVDFGSEGAWYVGAPEILLPVDHPDRGRVDGLAAEGLRVLLLAKASSMPDAGTLPPDLVAGALVLFTDNIRDDAADTIAYFKQEHVRPKVISGDNPVTVAAIARRCNVEGAEHFIDARDLPTEPRALAAAAQENAVFGRVTPEAKRALLHALQGEGEVVAMTGDGVNDTLALKEADLGIAMGSGTAAAKSVSQLVLLDNKFSTLPSVVAEGRRVIANIERVARLFVTKNAWAAVLAILTGIFTTSFPFLPRQLSVIDFITIGAPGFVLSFQPSHDPVRPGFIRRVLRFSIPAGVVTGIAAMAVFKIGRSGFDVSKETAQSGTTLALCAIGLWVLFELARPLDLIRQLLVAGLCVTTVIAFTVPPFNHFFELEVPPADYLAAIAGVVAVSAVLINVALRQVEKAHRARKAAAVAAG